MPYKTPRNYKTSKLLDDTVLMDIVNGILSLSAGQTLAITFGSTEAQKATRHRLYSILNGLERKEDFVISKRTNTTLEITNKVQPETILRMEILNTNNMEDTE